MGSRGKSGTPPPGKISYAEFIEAITYIATKEENPSNQKKIAMYLRDTRKYAKMQADLDQGFIQPEDYWAALAEFLDLPPPKEDQEERGGDEGEIVEEKTVEEVVQHVQQEEHQEVQMISDLLGVKQKPTESLEERLPFLGVSGLLHGGEEEVVDRLRELVVPVRTITNGLVLDLTHLSQVEIWSCN